MRASERKLGASGSGAIAWTSPVVTHGDIHEDTSDRGLKTHHQRFGVFTALDAFLGCVQDRGMHTKMETLIVERSDGIADDLVRQFASRLANQAVGFGELRPRHFAGHAYGRVGVEVNDDPSL